MYMMPKDKRIENILDRLIQHPAIPIDVKIARLLSKHKTIRYLRSKDKIYIGNDRAKNKSIILLSPSIKIEKNGAKFFFKGL
jgi:hypothetical protein